MTKIEEHLGIKFGEVFKIATSSIVRYYITSNLDLYRANDNKLSKDYTVLDLLREPKLIKRITLDKYDIMGLKFYQSKGFKYITRDKNGDVWIWKEEPHYSKSGSHWLLNIMERLDLYKHIPEFRHIDEIMHQEKNPYTIEEIIKKGKE